MIHVTFILLFWILHFFIIFYNFKSILVYLLIIFLKKVQRVISLNITLKFEIRKIVACRSLDTGHFNCIKLVKYIYECIYFIHLFPVLVNLS